MRRLLAILLLVVLSTEAWAQAGGGGGPGPPPGGGGTGGGGGGGSGGCTFLCGTAQSGVNNPGVGELGWLSGIYQAVSSSVPQGFNIIGKIETVDGSGNLIGVTANPNIVDAYGTPAGAVANPGVGFQGWLSGVFNNTQSPIPAGTNTIGKVITVSPAPAARNFPGCTVGTTSATCLASGLATTFVQIQNVSASAFVSCAWGIAAGLNASQSFQLLPGQSASWGYMTGGVPSAALNCISSTVSTPMYVEYN